MLQCFWPNAWSRVFGFSCSSGTVISRVASRTALVARLGCWRPQPREVSWLMASQAAVLTLTPDPANNEVDLDRLLRNQPRSESQVAIFKSYHAVLSVHTVPIESSGRQRFRTKKDPVALWCCCRSSSRSHIVCLEPTPEAGFATDGANLRAGSWEIAGSFFSASVGLPPCFAFPQELGPVWPGSCRALAPLGPVPDFL